MSLLTDDELVAELRSRVPAAAPPMSVDVPTTIRAGRRRRRARRWASGAASAAVAAGVVVAVVLGGADHAPAPVPPATASGLTVELAQDVKAVAGPVPGDGPTTDLGEVNGVHVRVTSTGDPVDPVWLEADGRREPAAGRTLSVSTDHTWGSIALTTKVVDFGTTPARLAGTRVFVAPVDGHLTDGALTKVLEVPTFALPGADDVRMYVLSYTAAPLVRLLYNVAFVGADGTVILQGCRAAESCAATHLLEELEHRLGPLTVVPDALADATSAPPADPSASVEVAPGIRAAGLAADGVLDLGDIDGRRVWLDIDVHRAPARVGAYHGAELQTRMPTALPLDPTGHDVGGSLDDARALLDVGVAPTPGDWRVFLWSAQRHGLGAGVVEIPTVPLGGRAYYAFVATDPSGLFDTTSTVVYANAAGDVVVPGCEGLSEAECDASTPGVFAEVRAALG